MPVLFVGHGSPMNAIENNAFTQALRDLSARLPKPKAVCVISAHWVTSGSHVLASSHPQTIHDFYGFPRALYEVEYPAPGAPVEAGKLAENPVIVPDEKWGLDHGSWSVLRHMYPNADVPAFQLSLDERRDSERTPGTGTRDQATTPARRPDSRQRKRGAQFAAD